MQLPRLRKWLAPRTRPATVAIGCVLLATACAASAPATRSTDPEFRTADVVGDAVIRELLSRDDHMMYISDHFSGIHYGEAAAALGALRFLARTGDAELLSRVETRYRGVPGTDELEAANHVDASVWGIVPLQLYHLRGDPGKLREGIALADAQWANPKNNGMSQQTRFWIDDIWMVNSLQTQAFRATGNMQYLDRAALQTEAYLERLQQPNGLFFHGPDAPFYWGRGNGWVAAGLAELLSVLPADHPRHAVIEHGYRKMMAALLGYQADDGMWRQLLDQPQSWKESSATAMFGYAFAVGVQRGILVESRYTAAFRSAWQALGTRVDENGRLTAICVGTGQSQDIRYYLERPTTDGDLHGQAPLLWFAAALMQQR